MRNEENLKDLVLLKPDFIGFIFYKKSKRWIEHPVQISYPNKTKKVGVFVNEAIDELLAKIQQFELDFIQLHGDETPAYCKKLKQIELLRKNGVELIKAFSVDKDFNFDKVEAFAPHCNLFLFDTKGEDYGGTGRKFDWSVLKSYKGSTPFLLSGGISLGDVEEIRSMKHSSFVGVDINSGFEKAPAMKNIEMIKEFKNKLI